MTNQRDDDVAPPMAAFAKQMQQASEEFTAQQLDWFQQMMGGPTGGDGSFGDLSRMSRGAAVFKTRVQSNGRISIPDAEREALDIEEGDLVQAFVVPLTHSDSDE